MYDETNHQVSMTLLFRQSQTTTAAMFSMYCVNWLEGNVARAESSVDISSFTQSHNHTTLAHVGILRINDERQSVLINCTDIS